MAHPPKPRGRFVHLDPSARLPGDSSSDPRVVRVYVPPWSGGAASEPPPTLVLFDGQNVFEDEGSFAGGWHAHLAADRVLASKKARSPAIVGVPHGGVERLVELSAWPVQGRDGRADVFLDWLAAAVIPRLRSELGLATAPTRTFVGGSSMGGLAALYAHLRHPDVFGGALCMSPSFFVGGRALRSWMSERPRPLWSRVYVDAGALEARGKLVRAARDMVERLERLGWPAEQLRLVVDARGRHNEADWRRRLPAALRFLFAR